MSRDLFHGGALEYMRLTFSDAPEPWIDLSTGINPWPWPVKAPDLRGLNHLPTAQAFHACQAAMAQAFGAPFEYVLPAPGSEILIRLLPTLIKAKTVAVLNPSYGDHARSWRMAGAQVIETSNPLSFADSVDVVVVCNPNNPDGRRFQVDDLKQARAALSARGGWLIIDEAYADIVPALSLAAKSGEDGLIILRSIGKVYGIAGLRLGALIAPQPIIKAMSERLGVWSLSELILSIGTQVYSDSEWLAHTKSKLSKARKRLDTILISSGLTVSGGTDLYRFVETENAHQLWEHLAQQAIYVRRFEGLDSNLRIGLPVDLASETRLTLALQNQR